MKILFVSLFLPREKAYHAGGRYVFELLRRLSAHHEIHLATRLEYPSLSELSPYCAQIHPFISAFTASSPSRSTTAATSST